MYAECHSTFGVINVIEILFLREKSFFLNLLFNVILKVSFNYPIEGIKMIFRFGEIFCGPGGLAWAAKKSSISEAPDMQGERRKNTL